MSKIRKILIALLAVCMTVCAGFALAACKDGENVINPDDPVDGAFNGKYVVTVQSRGGLGLNNVRVTVEKDGRVVTEKISNNGKIDFTLDPDEYDIVVDESTLPAGYSVPDEPVKTSAENGEVTVTANSKVIESPAPAGTRYKKGDVVYDFSFEDAVSTKTYTLSEELSTNGKFAVVLNFWGTTCNPCKSEFPAIQRAYEAYSEKLEIFALSSFGQDSESQIVEFKTTGGKGDYPTGYTFPMALDKGKGNIYQLFNVSVYPTTVIIDRYGVVAYVNTGSQSSESGWKAVFNKYTSAYYSQSGDISDGDDYGEIVYEQRPAGIEIPDAAAIESALAGERTTVESAFFNDEDKLAWPWKVEDGALSVSNASAGVSYSAIRFDISLKPLQGISFRFKANTYSNRNVFRLIMDGQILWEFSESTDGEWLTVRIPAALNSSELYYSRASRTVRVTLLYEKYFTVDEQTTVSVDDFTVYNVIDYADVTGDFAISVVDGLTPAGGKYTAADGTELYYYDESKDLYYTYYVDDNNEKHRTLLVADVNQVTAWTDKHYGNYYFDSPQENSSASYVASMYQFSYWFMSNWEEVIAAQLQGRDDVFATLNYDDDNLIMLLQGIQQFSDSGYVPVTKNLRAKLEAFTKQAYEQKDDLGLTDAWYEDQWLELCYYFRHYGDEHESGDPCFENHNPIEGYAYEYAYKFTMTGDEKTETITVSKPIRSSRGDDERESGGGIKYIFVPEKGGVYLFYTSYDGSKHADPHVLIVDLDATDYSDCILVDNDDDLRYDQIHKNAGNCYFYVVLEAGHKYGVTATVALADLLSQNGFAAQTYDLHVKYAGTYAEYLRVATTGGGFWSWTEDENGNPTVGNNGQTIFNYLAIDTRLVDGKYYVETHDEYGVGIGSEVYIDFKNPTYFMYAGSYALTLREAIYGTDLPVYDKDGNHVKDEDGNYTYVHLNGLFGNDTDKMKAYYELAEKNSITVGDEEISGLLHADRELVEILSRGIRESVDTGEWKQFACYRETFEYKE